MNPLYQDLNPMGKMLGQFKQFQQQFQGDPKKKVQELLQTGQMTNAQFNQLQQMASEFIKMLK